MKIHSSSSRSWNSRQYKGTLKYANLMHCVMPLWNNRVDSCLFTHCCESLKFYLGKVYVTGALGGLVVSVLATEPTGYSVAGSSLTEDGGFLRVIKIHSTHFLRRGSKAVGPMS
jgi:hypothetical protein